ncbi:GNAT family protein [Arsenicicoccus dermatophilus]|nr:GNAT family protein [Arsenicicoccus dermatophilus]MCH8611475.1 GNAT family N-acetyltransferase [Arsenicicoccus dermatophilus]
MVVEHGLTTMGLHRISLEVYDVNPRARHVYEKVGFVRADLVAATLMTVPSGIRTQEVSQPSHRICGTRPARSRPVRDLLLPLGGDGEHLVDVPRLAGGRRDRALSAGGHLPDLVVVVHDARPPPTWAPGAR